MGESSWCESGPVVLAAHICRKQFLSLALESDVNGESDSHSHSLYTRPLCTADDRFHFELPSLAGNMVYMSEVSISQREVKMLPCDAVKLKYHIIMSTILDNHDWIGLDIF